MASINKATLIGNVGKDPEIRYMPSGEAACNFSLATSESWKDKNSGERKEETQWHRISAFGRLAEIVGEYVKKGTSLYVEGKIKYSKYTDQSGVEKNTVEIVMKEMKILTARGEAGQDPAPAPRQQGMAAQRQAAPQRNQAPQRQAPTTGGASSGFDDMDDDIPFASSSMSYDMTTSKQRKLARYNY
jgi:single-strand DNA-binding protein